jgi:DNA-binding NarL/FixJ family response regulator
MDQIDVAILADDPLTREGATARLSAHPGIRVLTTGQHRSASVVLVITAGPTNRALRRVELARQAGGGHPHVVLVADDLSEQYILRAVRSGLVGLLHRSTSSYDQIIQAIEGAAARRTELPHRILQHLVSQIQLVQEPATPGHPSGPGLSVRDLEVLQLLSEGFTTREIATKLSYSERAVKNIVHNIVAQLQLRNRTHAVAHALRTGIL